MALPTHWAFFDTALGRCTLAWNDHGLTAVRLLHTHAPGGVPAGLQASEPGRQPGFVQRAIEGMQALLADAPDAPIDPLDTVPLDDRDTGAFERRVYAACRAVRPGHTCTYGELAHAIGDASALRAVGQALGRNPWPLVVPCHRVLAAGGRLGGFSAPGGADTKQRLLLIEAARVRRPDQLF